jgi:hypothetical protein
VGTSGKQKHIEPVCGTKIADEILEKFFGYVQGKAVHGAGHIHNKYVFTGWDLVLNDVFGRLHHKEKKVFIFSFKKKKPGFNLAAGEPVFQDEIPVAPVFFGGIEMNRDQGGSLVIDAGLM